jgi:Uma2 family endonuclease
MICLNAGTEINLQLKNRTCTAYESNMLIKTGDEVYTYPDLSVACGKPRIEFNIVHMLLNPTLIVEVLSPGTERYDRGEKFDHYQTIQTLQEYVLIAQDNPRIERYSRAQDGQWVPTVAPGLDAIIDLLAIGCTLALADVYHKTSLHPPKA